MTDTNTETKPKPVRKPAPEKTTSVYGALVAAQSKFPVLLKGSEGQVGSRKYSYLSYSEMIAQVMPILTAEGLCVFHTMEPAEIGSLLITTVFHAESETSISSSWRVQPEVPGDQAKGSSVTYGKRYTLESLLALASGEGDDDGAAAEPEEKRPEEAKSQLTVCTQKQVNMIGKMFDTAGFDNDARGEALQKVTKGRTENAAELTTLEASKTISRLQATIKAQQEEKQGPTKTTKEDEQEPSALDLAAQEQGEDLIPM